MKLIQRLLGSTYHYLPRRHALMLQVVSPVAPCYFALDLIPERVERFCDVSDFEILAFACDQALAPWINRPATAEGPAFTEAPDAGALRRALSGFSHRGPTFALEIGALHAREVPGPAKPMAFFSSPRSFSCKLPSGERHLSGRLMMSAVLRDHWLAHRGVDPQPLARTLSTASGLAALNLSAIAILASIQDAIPLEPGGDDDMPPELYALTTLPITHRTRRAWPDSPHDAWNAVRLAEQLLCCSGAVREDPTAARPVWRRGPRYHEAIRIVPEALLHLSGSLVRRFLAAGASARDAFVMLAGEEFGGQYPALLGSSSDAPEPTGHEMLEAAPLLEAATEASKRIAEHAGLASFLSRSHAW